MTKTRDKQNIFDIVLQQTGGINSAAQVLRDNGLNFNDSMVSGVEVITGPIESEKIKESFDLLDFKPNNSELLIVTTWILEGGIWNDFGTWIDTEFWQD